MKDRKSVLSEVEEVWGDALAKYQQGEGRNPQAGGKPGQGGDISGGGTMSQTMPIVQVKDLAIALAAYIAQKEKTE